MGDEVEFFLIKVVPILVLVQIGLVEGPDDAVTTKSLVHVGIHGTMKGVTDSVELVID